MKRTPRAPSSKFGKLDDVGTGLLEDDQEYAALAVRPGSLLEIFRTGHGLADVADSQRTAVAIGDDHIVPVLGCRQLIVGIDGVAAGTAVDGAFWTIDGRQCDLGAD